MHNIAACGGWSYRTLQHTLMSCDKPIETTNKCTYHTSLPTDFLRATSLYPHIFTFTSHLPPSHPQTPTSHPSFPPSHSHLILTLPPLTLTLPLHPPTLTDHALLYANTCSVILLISLSPLYSPPHSSTSSPPRPLTPSPLTG